MPYRDGDSYIVSGHKWWTSGAPDPRCKIAIFMGKTDLSAATYKQQSMILVPMDSSGVDVKRPLNVYGYDDAPHGHAEVVFKVKCKECCCAIGVRQGEAFLYQPEWFRCETTVKCLFTICGYEQADVVFSISLAAIDLRCWTEHFMLDTSLQSCLQTKCS